MKRRSLLLATGSGLTSAALGCGSEARRAVPTAALQSEIEVAVPTASTEPAPRASASVQQSRAEAPDAVWLVGAYLPLSGAESQFGVEARRGIELAIDAINAAGGARGRPLGVVFSDDASNASAVSKVVRQLVERDRVVALIGDIASPRSIAGGLVAAEKRVPMITPSSTNERVTEVSEYAFRACFVDDEQGTAAAELAVGVRKMRRLAMVFAENDLYSVGLAQSFRKAATKLGATLAHESRVMDDALDFTDIVKALKAAKPNLIFAPLYSAQMVALGRAARLAGFKNEIFLGGDGWAGDQHLLDEMEGACFTDHWAEGFPTAISRAFVAAHREKHQAAPTSLTATGYDATMLLADAMKRARSLAGGDLRDAIAATKAFASVTGPITINKARNAEKPITIVQVANKTTRYLDVVGPGADAVRAEAKARAAL